MLKSEIKIIGPLQTSNSMSNNETLRSCGNLKDSDVLGLAVKHAYEDFTPVRNATADLDSYDLRSLLKRRKRKRKAAPGSLVSKFRAFVRRDTNKENDYPFGELEATEIFQHPPTKTRKTEDVEKKRISEFRNRSLYGQQCSEWNFSYSPPPTPASSSDSESMIKWKEDMNSVLVDLGYIYESRLERGSVRQWLEGCQDKINQRDLRQVSKAHDLFVVTHVLYSDKFEFRQGSWSGEKKLNVARASLSATAENQTSRDTVTVRSEDLGKKPIAFKVMPLKVKKIKNKKPWTLALAPEMSRQFMSVPAETPSQETQASGSGKAYFLRVSILSRHS